MEQKINEFSEKIINLEKQINEIQAHLEAKIIFIERYLWGKFDLDDEEDCALFCKYLDM